MFWLNKAEKGLDNHSAIMTQGVTYLWNEKFNPIIYWLCGQNKKKLLKSRSIFGGEKRIHRKERRKISYSQRVRKCKYLIAHHNI